MKRDFAGREELPSILCFIFFKLERWQKAAGAPWCQEWFWQTLPPHQGGRKSCFIFLDKPGSNLLRNRETGELGKIFLPFLSFFTLFLLDFLLFFGFLAGYRTGELFLLLEGGKEMAEQWEMLL